MPHESSTAPPRPPLSSAHRAAARRAGALAHGLIGLGLVPIAAVWSVLGTAACVWLAAVVGDVLPTSVGDAGSVVPITIAAGIGLSLVGVAVHAVLGMLVWQWMAHALRSRQQQGAEQVR